MKKLLLYYSFGCCSTCLRHSRQAATISLKVMDGATTIGSVAGVAAGPPL